MYKAIIFDCGGVIIDLPTNEIMSYCADILQMDKEEFTRAYQECCCDAFVEGKITEKEMWQRVASTLNVDPPHHFQQWYKIAQNVFRTKESVVQCVAQLHAKGFKTGFLTNTEPPLVPYFENSDLIRYFDVAVYSCVEGVMKPNERIYHIMLERLGVLPQEAIFIDDMAQNIAAARDIGIKTILFENIKKMKEDLNDVVGSHLCQNT